MSYVCVWAVGHFQFLVLDDVDRLVYKCSTLDGKFLLIAVPAAAAGEFGAISRVYKRRKMASLLKQFLTG